MLLVRRVSDANVKLCDVRSSLRELCEMFTSALCKSFLCYCTQVTLEFFAQGLALTNSKKISFVEVNEKYESCCVGM